MGFVDPGMVLFIDSDGGGTLLIWQENGELKTELHQYAHGPDEFEKWCNEHEIARVQRIEFNVGEPGAIDYGGSFSGTTDLKNFIQLWHDLE